MTQTAVIEGTLQASADHRFVILASRFNDFIVDRLTAGAIDSLVRHGGSADHITVVRVPGAWELPLVAKQVATVAKPGSVTGIIALGALIRGATPHFDYIAAEVSKGLAGVSLDTGIPITFGVLTTDSIEQAIERAGTKAGNKGAEAAQALIELVSLRASLEAGLG